MSYCGNCGRKVRESDRFCSNCGARVNVSAQRAYTGSSDQNCTSEESSLDREVGRAFRAVDDSGKKQDSSQSRHQNTGYQNAYGQNEDAGYSNGYRQNQNTGYSDAYRQNQNTGYSNGYRQGQNTGYSDAYRQNQNTGYSNGYRQDQNTGYNDAYGQHPYAGYDSHNTGVPEHIKDDRNLVSFILLSLITAGIYCFYNIHRIAHDMNIVCKDEGDKTTGLALYIILSLITCGIYSLYWEYKLMNRVHANAPYYGIQITENGASVLIWELLGYVTCCICKFIAWHLLLKSTNSLFAAYNERYGL